MMADIADEPAVEKSFFSKIIEVSHLSHYNCIQTIYARRLFETEEFTTAG